MNNRGKVSLTFLIIVFIGAGCSPSPAPTLSLTQSSTQATSTLIPIEFPAPTETQGAALAPAATAEAPLRTKGPYLIYVRDAGDKKELVIMDADGMGRKTLPYPMSDQSLPWSLKQLVSPDGKWLAYYSGSAGGLLGKVGAETADLTLNLMSLESGETKTITRLLSKDYPANFAVAARELNKPYIDATGLQGAFLNGITQAIDWSPDGQYLAFAGQMNGLSSDLYLYDTNTESIKQLSSGPEEMQWVGWSPDGQWIVYGSTDAVGEGMVFDIYATPLDGSSTNFLEGSSGTYAAPTIWLDNRNFFNNDNANGLGDYHLRLINIETGAIREIWNGNFMNLTFDPKKKWIAFSAFFPKSDISPGETFDFHPGVQLINLATLHQVIAKIPQSDQVYMIIPVSLENGNFLVRGVDTLLLLSTDGSMTDSGIGDGEVIGSPDAHYLIVINDRMKVYSGKLDFLRNVDLPNSLPGKDLPGNIIWRPDSSGFFAIADRPSKNLYVIDLLSGDFRLVETNYSDSPNENYAWINP